VVVLTGGIASGKTAVSDHLASLGALVIDTDQIAKELTQPGNKGFDAIVEHWGKSIVIDEGKQEGQLNRLELRRRIFNNEQEKKTLEAMLHPMIMAEVRDQVDEAKMKKENPYAVVVIPLYVETNLELGADAIVVVDAPKAVVLERLMRRDGINKELAEQMIASQATREDRLAVATHVITNDKDLSSLKARTQALHQTLLEGLGHRI